jgi:hypothetical protein
LRDLRRLLAGDDRQCIDIDLLAERTASCSIAAGRRTSSEARAPCGALLGQPFGDLALVVVLPEPCRRPS